MTLEEGVYVKWIDPSRINYDDMVKTWKSVVKAQNKNPVGKDFTFPFQFFKDTIDKGPRRKTTGYDNVLENASRKEAAKAAAAALAGALGDDEDESDDDSDPGPPVASSSATQLPAPRKSRRTRRPKQVKSKEIIENSDAESPPKKKAKTDKGKGKKVSDGSDEDVDLAAIAKESRNIPKDSDDEDTEDQDSSASEVVTVKTTRASAAQKKLAERSSKSAAPAARAKSAKAPPKQPAPAAPRRLPSAAPEESSSATSEPSPPARGKRLPPAHAKPSSSAPTEPLSPAPAEPSSSAPPEPSSSAPPKPPSIAPSSGAEELLPSKRTLQMQLSTGFSKRADAKQSGLGQPSSDVLKGIAEDPSSPPPEVSLGDEPVQGTSKVPAGKVKPKDSATGRPHMAVKRAQGPKRFPSASSSVSNRTASSPARPGSLPPIITLPASKDNGSASSGSANVTAWRAGVPMELKLVALSGEQARDLRILAHYDTECIERTEFWIPGREDPQAQPEAGSPAAALQGQTQIRFLQLLTVEPSIQDMLLCADWVRFIDFVLCYKR